MCSCKLHCISWMQRFIAILIGHIKKCHRILSSEWPMSIASMLKLNLFYHFPCKRHLSTILLRYLRSIDANNLILFDKIHYRKIECAYSSQRLVLVVPIQMDKINTKLAFYIVSFKSITVPTDDPFSTFFFYSSHSFIVWLQWRFIQRRCLKTFELFTFAQCKTMCPIP